jgi:hypothetical protein
MNMIFCLNKSFGRGEPLLTKPAYASGICVDSVLLQLYYHRNINSELSWDVK